MSLEMVNRVWQGSRGKRSEIKWLAFLNTVRTEHFDQVLALRPLMAAIADAA
jgi:hypothetical protein